MVATAKPCKVYTVFAWQVLTCSSAGSTGVAGYQAVCYVGRYRVFFGVCCLYVGAEDVMSRSPVLIGRAGQLFCVGKQAAVCAPGLIEGGVRGD